MEVIQIEIGKIRIDDNGPYQVSGKIQLLDNAGNMYETSGTYSLCRCGHSQEKPFCDGSHEEIAFKSSPRADELMVEV